MGVIKKKKIENKTIGDNTKLNKTPNLNQINENKENHCGLTNEIIKTPIDPESR